MDEDTVMQRLETVTDPDLDADIVQLGLVNAVECDNDDVRISLALGAPYAPHETAIGRSVREALADIAADVELQARLPPAVRDPEVLPEVRNIVCVASGKGGVGKSTVAVNLAAGLAALGADVGLFDADIYGPNVPRMVDAGAAPEATPDQRIIPPEQFGMKLMSMAFLVGEDDPVIWRGPMVHQLLTQFIDDVEWGSLDYLVVDLPPGTGDTQLTVLQSLPVTGAVVVTTPQAVALDDATKGLRMFARHETPVLGIVENMSGFTCPDCGTTHQIFDADGGRALAGHHELPYLGAIPLDPAVRAGGDTGAPVVLGDGDAGTAMKLVTENVANMVGVLHRRAVRRTRGQRMTDVEATDD